MQIRNCLRHVVLAAALLFTWSATAQEDGSFRGFFLGVGTGQDAGGIIGAKATYWMAPYLAGFIGGGWAAVDGGWNAGVEVRLPTRSRAQPFATAMYGYNGVIRVRGTRKAGRDLFWTHHRRWLRVQAALLEQLLAVLRERAIPAAGDA